MGNFRWLDSSKNRSRGDGLIYVDETDTGFIEPAKWNRLIEKVRWEENDVAEFQKLIDLRTVSVIEELLESGLRGLPSGDVFPVAEASSAVDEVAREQTAVGG